MFKFLVNRGISLNIICLMAFFSLIFLCTLLEYYSCRNYGRITNNETKFSLVNGCFVKKGNNFVHSNELRAVTIKGD